MPLPRVLFYLLTMGGIVVSLRTIFIGPPPLAVAFTYVNLYIGVILIGVFVLRLRMFADAIVRGPENARGIVLTFDDGPHPVHTRKVLDILDEHGAKATFFV